MPDGCPSPIPPLPRWETLTMQRSKRAALVEPPTRCREGGVCSSSRRGDGGIDVFDRGVLPIGLGVEADAAAPVVGIVAANDQQVRSIVDDPALIADRDAIVHLDLARVEDVDPIAAIAHGLPARPAVAVEDAFRRFAIETALPGEVGAAAVVLDLLAQV